MGSWNLAPARCITHSIDRRHLEGREQIQLKDKAKTYPDELAHAVICANPGFRSAWAREVFATRQDILPLYESYSFAQKRILTLLFGLNHLYHPGFKWIDRRIAALFLAPPSLSLRFKEVWNSEPVLGTRLFHALIEETFSLIDLHMPEVSTAQARAVFEQRPREWEQAPGRVHERTVTTEPGSPQWIRVCLEESIYTSIL